MSNRFDLYLHLDPGTPPVSNTSQLDRIEGLVIKMSQEMDALSASVGKLVTDIDTTIAAAQAASTTLHTQLDAAIAAAAAAAENDSADAATIADLQQQLADIKASAVTLTNSLQAADQKVTDAGANLTPPVQLPPVPDPLPPADATV